jgi:hypothetical protein
MATDALSYSTGFTAALCHAVSYLRDEYGEIAARRLVAYALDRERREALIS